MKLIPLFFTVLFAATIVSCDNQTKSTNSAKELSQSNIKVVSPKEVYDALQQDSAAQLIDVRSSDEYGVTHLKNSQNICVTAPDFKEKAAKLDKNKPVYVYCKRGGRSAQASLILAEMGFTQIYDLQGGITNWQSQELETIKG